MTCRVVQRKNSFSCRRIFWDGVWLTRGSVFILEKSKSKIASSYFSSKKDVRDRKTIPLEVSSALLSKKIYQ